MCGVLGIQGKIQLHDAKSLLQLLVHRGQDASGLVWIDSYDVQKRAKAKGAPSEIDIDDEVSSATIGSTRYPTLGNRYGEVSKDKFAQPFSYQTKLGTLSVAHNGNITNMKDISDQVYQSDAELITELLGKKINTLGSLEEGLKAIAELLDGAYSIVGLLGNDLFCFRDPRGIRPLVIGHSKTHTVVASESICLQQSGINEFTDVAPGELVFSPRDGGIYRKQLVETKNISHCFFEYVYFASSVSNIEGKNVYETRLKLGSALAKEIEKKGIDIDYIVPVPDTSKAACETLSSDLKVPLREAIMKNRSSLRTFIMPGLNEREKAAKSKYLFVDRFIRGKKLLIVDDSIVRGFTTMYLIKILRERGAKEVHVGITCPPQRFACYYGVDFGTDNQLIAKNNTKVEDVEKIIGADTLTYLPIESMIKVIGMTTLCTACINGRYPTPNGERIRLLVKQGKLDDKNTHYEISHMS